MEGNGISAAMLTLFERAETSRHQPRCRMSRAHYIGNANVYIHRKRDPLHRDEWIDGKVAFQCLRTFATIRGCHSNQDNGKRIASNAAQRGSSPKYRA